MYQQEDGDLGSLNLSNDNCKLSFMNGKHRPIHGEASNKVVCPINILLNTPDVLTVKEAATVLKLGRTTMYRLIHERTIKHVKVGRKILIPKLYLQYFLENSAHMCHNHNQMVGNLPCCQKGAKK